MPATTDRRVAAAVTLGAAALLLAGCAPAQGGPLKGPRAEPGTVEACVPAGTDRQIYFGEVLTNAGEDDVTITEVASTGENLGFIEYTLDLEGPALDQVLGGGWWPTDEPWGSAAEVFGRDIPAIGAVIAPGSSASLLMQVNPDSPSDDAVANSTVVSYTSGGRDYAEHIAASYRVHAGDACG